MHCLAVLSVLATVSLGLATHLSLRWGDMRVKHSRDSIPDKWEYQCYPPVGTTIDLCIALKPHRESALIDALYEVSGPNHSKYGAHLSKEQVPELVVPHPDTLELVGSWFEQHEVPSLAVSITHDGGWLTIKKVALTEANALLGASYQNHCHTETNGTVIHTVGYSLPAVMRKHVQTVAPTTYPGSPRPLRQPSKLAFNAPTLPDGDLELQDWSTAIAPSNPIPSNCPSIIMSTCLRLLYKTWAYELLATSKDKIGITGYLEGSASYSDLTRSLTRFRKEADFDIRYTESISYPTSNIFYSTAGAPPCIADDGTPTNMNEPLLNWLEFVLCQETIPQTISTSYGDDEQTVPLDYATSVCNVFGWLGAMGISVLFSSGESSINGGSCNSNDGTNYVKFIPAFPAPSCPFVTAVGGPANVNPEVAASLSGGGFSNYFSHPSYQNEAVFSYLQNIDSQYSGLFNTTGYGYLDISAQAMNYQVVLAGEVVEIDSTSAATPRQISTGLPQFSDILYSTAAKGFNDITSGSNPGCGTSGFSGTKV